MPSQEQTIAHGKTAGARKPPAQTGDGVPAPVKAPQRGHVPAGTRLAGRYVLEELIGHGGMATVYRAQDEVLRREVAVKVLHEYLVSHDEAVERFLREARMLAAVDSQHIVPIYDVGNDQGSTFLVMKFLKAPTLGSILAEKKRLPPDEAVRMCEQLLCGLEALHALELVHRDVKPANIVVHDGRDVTLLDLGIVTDPYGHNTLTQGVVLGTAAYMSPEQALGDLVDERSDIYSVGITMFELLTGEVPFSGETTTQVCMKHVHDAPPSPRDLVPDISEALSDVVVRALAKRPEQRFQTANEMREALTDALAGKTPKVPRVTGRGAVTSSGIRGPGTMRVTAHQAAPERRRALYGMLIAGLVVSFVALLPEFWDDGQTLAAEVTETAELPEARAVSRARGLIELGDAQGAIELLEPAIAQSPDRVELYRDLGAAYAAHGDRAAAIGAYRTYLEREPEARDAAKVKAIVDKLAGR